MPPTPAKSTSDGSLVSDTAATVSGSCAPRLPRLWRGGGSPRRWRRARAARARARTSSWRSAARADLRRRSVTTSRRVLGSAEKAGARRLRARVSHCDSSFAATRAAEGAPRSSGVREDARAPRRMSRPRSVSMRSATRAACTDPRGGGWSRDPNSSDQASSASARRGTSARSASRSARRCRPICRSTQSRRYVTTNAKRKSSFANAMATTSARAPMGDGGKRSLTSTNGDVFELFQTLWNVFMQTRRFWCIRMGIHYGSKMSRKSGGSGDRHLG